MACQPTLRVFTGSMRCDDAMQARMRAQECLPAVGDAVMRKRGKSMLTN